MMQIHDPIHGYINLDGLYAHIVNTPEFQRLRSIEQVSFRPVYPGARHDRFLHSLGTYHLAGKFVDCFFRNLEKDLKLVLPAAEEKLLRTTFAYAALLHDIGHAPFSHTTENFFAEEKSLRPSADPDKDPYPQIWDDLCLEVQKLDPIEGELFFRSGKKQGASHEIMSATLLIENRDTFIPKKKNGEPVYPDEKVDLPLAARMVIGFPYCIGDQKISVESRGVRNCLIRLLNGEVLDVDRLDYMGRDTLMTGYSNAPLDLECLANSVTAVRLDNNELALAYQDSALAVFDLMFQAKISHDAWVIGNPAGKYDAALRIHCIRKLGADYIREVFCREALSYTGKPWNGKTYRLLDDSDIMADLKARSGLGDHDFDELFTREPGKRRTAAWRSYYEYHRIFNSPYSNVTPESVYAFFSPLIQHMDDEKIFIFNEAAYNTICVNPETRSRNSAVLKAAHFLRQYLRSQVSEAEKKDNYNVVLLDQTLNLTMKLNPASIRIAFPRANIPKRCGNMNYASYGELTGLSAENIVKRKYFYLLRYSGLGHNQLDNLCDQLAAVL